MGVTRPKTPSFTLNIAVDELLKKEFDIHRVEKTAHPLMKEYGIDAVPFLHKDMDLWRHNFTGIQYRHKETDFLITGAIDDIWVNPKGELIVVDYKATSKEGKITTLDDSGWHDQYKRQVEIYQWLLKQSGFNVSQTAYFVYVNGRTDKKAFDATLEFDITLIALKAEDDAWIEPTLIEIKKCLTQKKLPPSGKTCEYCSYMNKYREVLQEKAEPVQTSPDSTPKQKTKTKTKKVDLEVEASKQSLF